MSVQKIADHKRFILSKSAIDSISEHASTPVTDKGSLVQPAMCVNRLHCKQKRIAPDPWKMGVPKKTVTIDVTNYLHVWLQNNMMSTLRRSIILHPLVFEN
jgi:hypothetical protein